MRRRLDLAAALVAKPPVLFLDEPTTGLDPRSRLGLWEVIEGLVAEGTTVLLTTQYLDEADRLADTIAVIDHGRLIAEGTSDQLKDRLGGERLEVRLDEDADPQAAVQCTGGDVRRAAELSRGAWSGSASASAAGAIVEAVHRLSEAGIGVDDLALRRPTLDDVFLSLTGHAAEAAPPRRRSTMPHETTRHRHPDHRRAKPDPAAARARTADRLHRPADHVRAAVPLRLRRRDPHARLQLRRLPDSRHHRPEHGLRRLRDRPRPQRGRAARA